MSERAVRNCRINHFSRGHLETPSGRPSPSGSNGGNAGASLTEIRLKESA